MKDGERSVWGPILLLALAITAIRVVYVGWLSPYALVEDEAHYWEWSRHLDWSYYSKGPGVAWAIAASTAILGDSVLAIRLPAIIACAIAAIGVAGLSMDVTGYRRAGLYAAAVTFAAPFFVGAGMFMTIDMPYIACWAVACWASWRAIERGSASAWIVAAAAIGAGFLFKYTILLLVAGLLVYALIRRRPIPRAGLIGAVIVGLICLAPVIIWNAQRDWPTVRHLLGHVGVKGGDQPASSEPFSVLWPLTYLAVQLLLIGPALVHGVGVLIWLIRNRVPQSVGTTFVMCCAAPIFLFYFVVSFMTDGEANWAAAGHVSFLAMAGFGAAAGTAKAALGDKQALPRWVTAWRVTVIVGVATAAVMASPHVLARLPVVGAYIPIERISFGPLLATEVQAELDAAPADEKPFVLTSHYGAASLLAYYLDGQPVVYCGSARLPGQGRRTQYDYWASSDLDDPSLIGRNAILIGSAEHDWAAGFERIGEPRPAPGGDSIMIGYGYRGFGEGR